MGTPPPEGFVSLDQANTVFENCLCLLRRGSAVYYYGLFRTAVLRQTRFLKLGPFDWKDAYLLHEITSLGKIHIVPKILFHRGYVGAYNLKSFSRWKLPGFRYGYKDYYLESARCFLESKQLTVVEKLRLIWDLTVSTVARIYWHEQLPRPLKVLIRCGSVMLKWIGFRRSYPGAMIAKD